MSRARAVLFDLGDTLVERPAGDPGRRLATALGLDEDQAGRITSLAVRTVFASPQALASRIRSELGLATDPTAAVTAVWDALLARPDELPGATTCVAALRATGAKIGVVANVWEPEAAGVRACAGLAALIDSWHLSCEAGAAKPNAAIFQAALAALEVAPARALMVGDSLEDDVVPALALGMSAIWLRREPAVVAAVDTPGVVSVDPHRASWPMPADGVLEGALIATHLSQVRRIALTWMWAGRGIGVDLTAPLGPERPPA